MQLTGLLFVFNSFGSLLPMYKKLDYKEKLLLELEQQIKEKKQFLELKNVFQVILLCGIFMQ